MCGLLGYQFRPNFRPNYGKRLLLANALGRVNVKRGHDSFGWFSTDSGDIRVELGEATGRMHEAARSFSLLGHTRHATVGAVTIPNAHPFHIGDVVGAHNGGISNHGMLNVDRKATGNAEFEVDSMHLIDALDTGLEACRGLKGWGAVSWVNMHNPHTIRLCRLTVGGDLAIAQCQAGMIWSSDEGALREAMKESGFVGIQLKLESNIVYDIHNGVIRTTTDKIELDSLPATNQYATRSYGSRYADHGRFPDPDRQDMLDMKWDADVKRLETEEKSWVERGKTLSEKFAAGRKKDKTIGKKAKSALQSIMTAEEIAEAIDLSKKYNLCENCYQELGLTGSCVNNNCSLKASLDVGMR